MKVNVDEIYNELAELVLEKGKRKGDRTGTGTISHFGSQIEFDLQEGFPLLSGKRLPIKAISNELFWFLSGSTDLKDLLDRDVNIWTDDAYRFHKEQGGTLSKDEFIEMARTKGFDMGPIYGEQFRNWGAEWGNPVDQIAEIIDQVKNNPDSRRMLVSAYNPSVLGKIALPACHTLFQLYVSDGELSCKMYQRSCDIFLGLPFNIASYALLVHLIATMLGLKVGRLIITFGDAHIYNNHVNQIKEQISRPIMKMPKLYVKTVKDRIEDYTFEDIELVGYKPHPGIKGKLSVGN